MEQTTCKTGCALVGEPRFPDYLYRMKNLATVLALLFLGVGCGTKTLDKVPVISGTRLKVAAFGAKYPDLNSGLRDTKLNVPCVTNKASDGKIRCLPGSYGASYSDANCTKAVLRADICATESPKYVLDPTQQQTEICGASPAQALESIVGYKVYKVSGKSSGKIYFRGSDNKCVEDPSSTVDTVLVTTDPTEVPPTEFVEFKTEQTRLSNGFTALDFKAADGTSARGQIFRTDSPSDLCYFERANALSSTATEYDLVCVPNRSFVQYSSSATCATLDVAQRYGKCDVLLASKNNPNRSCDPKSGAPIHFIDLYPRGGTFDKVYQSGGDSCVEVPLSSTDSFFSVSSAAVDPNTFPKAKLAPTADDDKSNGVVVMTQQLPDGTAFRFDGFRDRKRDQSCFPRLTDSGYRCLPENSTYAVQNDAGKVTSITVGYFSDAACTQPVEKVEACGADQEKYHYLVELSSGANTICGSASARAVAVRSMTKYTGSLFLKDFSEVCAAVAADSKAVYLAPGTANLIEEFPLMGEDNTVMP
jgi:hypothetical protein